MVTEKKQEYILDKYTFQEPYEVTTVIDKAIVDIHSYDYGLDINLENSYIDKVNLVLSFLKIDNSLKIINVEDKTHENTYTELRGKSGYATIDSFLVIEFVSNNIDKYLLYESYKKFNDYLSSFKEKLSIKYELLNRQVARKWKQNEEKKINKENIEGKVFIMIVFALFFIVLASIINCVNK